jgi:hypothetical protein
MTSVSGKVSLAGRHAVFQRLAACDHLLRVSRTYPYHAQVLAADVEQLDTWIDAVFDAESIDAVFGRPTAH